MEGDEAAKTQTSQISGKAGGRNNNRGNRNNGGRYRNQNNNSNGRQNEGADQNANPNKGRGGGQHGRGGGRFNRQKHRAAKDFDSMIKNRKDHGGVPMTGNISDCVICCQPSDVFGVGNCRHPVCMECCVRMRILDDSKSCPQCRGTIETLTFMSAPKTWSDDFKVPTTSVDHKDAEKHGIKFTDQHTVDAYEGYLAHVCNICLVQGSRLEFPTFGALRHHVANMHYQLFCSICCEHLNILTKDRISYSHEELKRHIEGEMKEVMGQKGHPKCLFCEERFFDVDFQYRHLRMDHFYCQICETNGGENVFYRRREELHAHYKRKHYPCNDSECAHLGIVFRTDVELGVHHASEHGSGPRNVNIDFQFTGRNLGNRILRNNEDRSTRNANPEPAQPPPPPPVSSTIVPSAQAQRPRVVPSRTAITVVPSAQNAPAPRPIRPQAFQPIVEDFPSLPAAQPVFTASPSPHSNWRQEVQAMRNVQRAPGVQINSAEQFPSLSNATPINPAAEFPSLGSTTKKNKPANNIWAKGRSTALFTNDQQPKQKPKLPEQSRRHILPAPDIWPEGMRERVEARMKGLPDPGNSEPIPIDPLFRVEASKRAKRAEKKKKQKSVAAGTVLSDETVELSTIQSKFSALQEVEEDMKSKKTSQLASLSRTADNFVRIESAPTLRSVAASIGTKKDPSKISKEESESAKKEEQQIPSDLAPGPSSPSSSAPPPAFNSNFSSLTEIVGGLWPFGKSESTPSGNNAQQTSGNDKTAWSTGPPPGFS